MCGIAGIVGRNAAAHAEAVRRMTAALRHRGPDGTGLHIARSGACVLGHTRLAILDPSAAADQPITAGGGRFALTYNGECYNFAELRDGLAERGGGLAMRGDGLAVRGDGLAVRGDGLAVRGAGLASTGDTEVVLHCLARRGAAALPAMNGMFALALWDDDAGELLLARDRFGQKPLYFARSHGLFLFASEVRALLASGLIERVADPQAIVGFLSFGTVPEPRTIVRGVAALAPASHARVQPDGSLTTKTYWRPPADKHPISAAELKSRFAGAVERHLVSDAPIGLFLSGGIDSTAVTIAAARVVPERLQTVCVVCPDQPHISEQRFARRIAELAGTDHHEVPFTEAEQLELIPEALAAQDQPSVDGTNTYVVSVAARRAGLKVALSGLGGDELFGGYRSSFTETLQLLRLARGLGPSRGAVAALLRRLPTFANTPAKLADVLASPGDLLSSYLVRRKLFTSAQVRAMFPGLAGTGWCDGLPGQQLEELRGLVEHRDPRDAIGLLEMRRYMGQQLLRDSDVMGMAHGLEIRVPFLDTDFAETALRLDPAVRAPGGVPKHHFVACLGDWLPEDTRTRRKQGFQLPMHQAMLGPLRGEVQAGLRELRRRFGDAVDPTAVERSWAGFTRHPERRGWARTWGLFVLSRTLERLDLRVALPRIPHAASARVRRNSRPSAQQPAPQPTPLPAQQPAPPPAQQPAPLP